MKKIVYVILATLIISSSLIGTSMAQEEYVLKYSWMNPLDPFVSGTSAFAHAFKNELETLSRGRIKVELYPANQLGDALSVAGQVRRNTVQMCDINIGVLASAYLPKLGVFELPYSFDSAATALRLLSLDNPFTKKLCDELREKTDLRVLAFGTFGFRCVANNRKPIHTVDDLKGLKIRMQESTVHVKLMEALGAQVTAIPWGELYTSLQTKVVDGQDAPPNLFVMEKFYEVQNYYTLTNHILGIGTHALLSEKFYQSLPDDLKIVLLKAYENCYHTCQGHWTLLDSLAMDEMRERGVEIYIPTEEELATFKEKGQEPVKKWMEEEYGADFVAEYLAAIEEVQEDYRREVEASKL